MPSFRSSVEQRSAVPLHFLNGLPRAVVTLGPIVLLAIGMALPSAIGWLPVVLALAFFGWLSYLSWPVAPAGGRAVRLVILLLVTALLVSRLS